MGPYRSWLYDAEIFIFLDNGTQGIDMELIKSSSVSCETGMKEINRKALFADGTDAYILRHEDHVEIWFRALKGDVSGVMLCVITEDDTEEYSMQRFMTRGLFEYYHAYMPEEAGSFKYYYKAVKGDECIYFNRAGAAHIHNAGYDFSYIQGFVTPEWAKGAVMYQIFTDRFCNGNKNTNVRNREYYYANRLVEHVEDWDALPEAYDVHRHYGGDLQGVIDKLPYLKDLGVDVLYMNPLFVSPSNHKYDTQDYDHIDPHFGKIVEDDYKDLGIHDRTNKQAYGYIKRTTSLKNLEASNALFAELTEKAHALGMRVIMDGVFNHCGSFNKWLDREKFYSRNKAYEKGAYITEESPYNDFFKFTEDRWPDNGSYEGWWGFETLPKLNYEASEKLTQYILDIGAKWLKPPYNIDGWRLDVAADLGHSQEFNHAFWKKFRDAVKRENPDALILSEHYGDASSWLRGDEWDTVMNYDAFMEPVTWMLTGMEKHSDAYNEGLDGNADAFVNTMIEKMNVMPYEALYVAMNELSNHDHSRFLTRTNRRAGRIASLGSEAASQGINYGIFRTGVVMQMTWPGAPTIYYGDEAGVCGWTDPDCRRTYPWGHEKKELIDFHKDIIRIHKESNALMRGSFRFLGKGDRWVAYGRFDDNEQIAVVVNNSSKPQLVSFDVWPMGTEMEGFMERLIRVNYDGYTCESRKYEVKEGKVKFTVPGYGCSVLKFKKV